MMMTVLARRSVLLAVVVGIAGLPEGSAVAQAAEARTVTGTTRPSQHRSLSFHLPGIVHEVPVKEGDRVAAGQLLMAADDRMEAKLLEAMRLEANSTLPVEAAEAELDMRKVTLEKIEEGYRSRRAFSEVELREAQLAVKLADLRHRQAGEESQLKGLQADRQAVRVELMSLLSPIDGVVEKLETGVGEVVDPAKPSVIVVSNDPLWVEFDLPTSQAARLNLGQTLEVRYVDGEQWMQGQIIYFAPVADARSDTQMIRIELANPSNRNSGLEVRVKLPEAVTLPDVSPILGRNP